MNPKRRSGAAARRQAEAEILEEVYTEDKPRPLVDSKTTVATPCPYDPPDTEETLP